MGWSNTAMAARYQHLTAPIRNNIAKQVGGLLWLSPDRPGDDDDDGPEASPVPA
jgi:hypothetical protein